MSVYKDVEQALLQLREKDLYRSRLPLQSAQGPEISVAGTRLINFSSNDYLGLANDTRLKDWLIEALQKHGVGAGASQLIVGYNETHRELELAISSWLQRDASLLFPSGYMANLAIASTLIDKTSVVIQDKLNHASLVDAATLSPGRLVRYPHSDMQALERLLQKHSEKKRVVMTDGVFSMDGDCARLQEIAELCTSHDALLIVDDAHGIGALGKQGAGLLETLGLTQQRVPLLVATFGKAFGIGGAFVSGDSRLIELLVQKARTYIYTTAMLPAVAATLVKTLELVRNASDLRQHLQTNIQLLKSQVPTLTSDTHIQPLVIGTANGALNASNRLREQGVLAMAIRPPTVPSGTARLRLSLSAAHTRKHIDTLGNAVNELFAV